MNNCITKLALIKNKFGPNDSIKVSANDTFLLAQMICEFGASDTPFGANVVLLIWNMLLIFISMSENFVYFKITFDITLKTIMS